MTEFETIQAIRKDIIGEIDAIIQYDNHINTTNNQTAKKIWTSIRNEEMVHVGELFTILSQLDPETTNRFLEGEKEVQEILKSMSFQNRILK